MRTGFIVALAVAAGLSFGAGFVYLNGGLNGNGELAANAADGDEFSAKADQLRSMVKGDLQAFRVLDKPIVLEDVSFNNGDGEPTSMMEELEDVTLINIWATWCAPCREEMPDLAELQEHFSGDSDFEVMTVSIDKGSPAKPAKFFHEIGVENLPLHQDGHGKLFRSLQKQGLLFGLPTTLLADGDGTVFGVLNGPADWASEDAVYLIDSALKVLD